MLKKIIRKGLSKYAHVSIFRTLPRGMDPIEDIKKNLPNYRCDVIFDVGANIGQSAELFRTSFPEAKIYCFEPVKTTYYELREKVTGKENIFCFNMALGESSGTGNMVLDGNSSMSYLSKTSHNMSQEEQVEIESLDNFCTKNNIIRVSYLKIDTEGHDLDVLKGSKRMLGENQIEIIELEAGMNPKNTRHVAFEELKKYLEKYGYYLFGIYEQVHEWPTHEPHLRRTNPVFVSQSVIAANKL